MDLYTNNCNVLGVVCDTALKVLDEVVGSDTESAFTKPTTADELSEHNKQMNAIVLDKIRQKFKL